MPIFGGVLSSVQISGVYLPENGNFLKVRKVELSKVFVLKREFCFEYKKKCFGWFSTSNRGFPSGFLLLPHHES